MNSRSVHPQSLFDDYLFNPPIRNKSPCRIPLPQQDGQISFAQLSKQSRPTSRRGLFRMEIEKSKLKEQKNQINNPYFLLAGSAQPAVSKSPSKLLSLKSYGSYNGVRPRSPLKGVQNFVGFAENQNIKKVKSNDTKIRISFSSLTKNQNRCSTTSGTSNESSKENHQLLSNYVTAASHITQSRGPSFTSSQISKAIESMKNIGRQMSSSVLPNPKESMDKQIPKYPIKTNVNSFFQDDHQVNISISDSMAILNLDMNPYLI